MNYYVQSHIHRWVVKERKHSPSMAFCLDECTWVRAVLFPTLYTMPSAAPQNVSVSASTARSVAVKGMDLPLDHLNGLIEHFVVRYFPTND